MSLISIIHKKIIDYFREKKLDVSVITTENEYKYILPYNKNVNTKYYTYLDGIVKIKFYNNRINNYLNYIDIKAKIYGLEFLNERQLYSYKQNKIKPSPLLRYYIYEYLYYSIFYFYEKYKTKVGNRFNLHDMIWLF